MEKLEKILKEKLGRFNKIVIWGLRDRHHTHRTIHKNFYHGLKRAGVDVRWVEDSPSNQGVIEPGDLVISSEVAGKMVPAKKEFSDYHLPIRNDIYYCLHNFQEIFTGKIDQSRLLNLQVYSNISEAGTERWDTVTYFDKDKHILYQPWGTNLFPDQFRSPAFNQNKNVYWIGSVWNNDRGQGNLKEVGELKAALAKNGLRFVQVRFIPDFLNTFLVRRSRLAPAIGGKFQVDINYLPDRMFKNISYGQLGFSNIKKFDELFAGCAITGETIEELVAKALALSEREYKEIILAQQSIVAGHTPGNKLLNIAKAFDHFV